MMGEIKGAGARVRDGNLRTALVGALAMTTALATTLAVSPAWAQQAAASSPMIAQLQSEQNFNIPAQPLTDALVAFGQQSGVQVTVNGTVARNVSAPAVRGTMTREQALRQILAGSGLTYTMSGSTVVIERPEGATDGAMVLTPITVEAKGTADPGQTEGSGSYAGSTTTVGSKIPTSIREIPQSVSVVTRQRLDDQNLLSLQDAIAETTGMRVQKWDADRATFMARGQEVQLLRDGVPVTHQTTQTAAPDLAIYDRVEVMRGPAGLFHGAGDPGGSINLVRKRALQDFQVKGAVRTGSWDFYRAEGDVTGSLVESGKIRGRFVTAYQDKHSYVDLYESELPIVYGTIEADPTPNTTLSMGAIYQENRHHNFQGLPIAFSNGERTDLSRNTNFGAEWSKGIDYEVDTFLQLEHEFDNGISTNVNARYVERWRDGIVHYVNGLPDVTTGSFAQTAWKYDNSGRDVAIDANMTAPVTALGQTQNFLLGVDNTYGTVNASWVSATLANGNVYAANHSITEPTFGSYTTQNDTVTRQTGAYAQGNIKPGVDWLTLVVGGRATWWNSVTKNRLTGATTSDVNANGEIVQKYGAVADVSDDLSVYASYATIFDPQTSLTPSGKVVDPRVGEQYEIGLKGEFHDGKLIGHVAAYQINDENRATAIDGCAGSLCYEAAGLVRSQGVEAEISGELFPNWQVFAGYAYTYAKYVTDPSNAGNDFSNETPKHMLTLTADYKFKEGTLKGLSLGGGLRGRSSYYTSVGAYKYYQNPFVLLDARVGYELNENLSGQLAITNLLDKAYYERLDGTSRNNFWGEPRAVMFSVRGEW